MSSPDDKIKTDDDYARDLFRQRHGPNVLFPDDVRKMRLTVPTPAADLVSLHFYTEWSPADQEYAGCCAEFPSLSHMAPTRAGALAGITALASEIMKDCAGDNG